MCDVRVRFTSCEIFTAECEPFTASTLLFHDYIMLCTDLTNSTMLSASLAGLRLNPVVSVVTSTDDEAGKSFISSVNSLCSSSDKNAKVAFDCEGVNLSRLGSVEIVSICFSAKQVYLVDFGKEKCPKVVAAVKKLFECSKVTKIIHDCRMDCDALYHNHGIKLNNVHDTSAYHDFIGYGQNKNLNDTLSYNGIRVNADRDKSVYKSNPNFWATRPLTKKMIDWASSDVDKLFQLAEKQLEHISSAQKSSAVEKSATYARLARDMDVESGLRVRGNIGLFIGRGGANIRSLERKTGCLIYSVREEGTWFVFYPNNAALNTVKRRMNR